MSIINQTIDTIEHFQMVTPGDNVLVAVSGGPDSVALFTILNTLRHELKISLALAHLNHGIRPVEADKEEAFVRRLARDSKIPCFHSKILLDPQEGSLEERARRERYRFLTHTARSRGFSKIALGHQADDNAEVVMMNLIRGTGIRGLGGIPPVRDRWIIRPFIEVRRHQILAYLKAHHITFMQDASNEDVRFTRNRIRHQVLPMLEKAFNHDIVGTLNRTAGICREEEGWFQSHLHPLLTSIQVPTSDDSLVLKLGPFTGTHPAIQRRLIRYALEHWRGHLQRLAAVHVESVIEMATKGKEARLNLPEGLVAHCTGNRLRFFIQNGRDLSDTDTLTPYSYIIRSKQDLPAQIPIPTRNGALRLRLMQPPPSGEVTFRHANYAWLDADALHFPLVIRNAHPGDRMVPLGMQGTQKLKEVFINAKVPRQQRWGTPLVVSNNDVLWVVGLRRSNLYLVTGNTREVLAMEWASSLMPDSGGLEKGYNINKLHQTL